jgi:hypothetical protein
MVPTIQSYVQEGFAPTNLALFGAASDGQTVGAVQVLTHMAQLTVSTTGSGTVFSSDEHINCGSTRSYVYPTDMTERTLAFSNTKNYHHCSAGSNPETSAPQR